MFVVYYYCNEFFRPFPNIALQVPKKLISAKRINNFRWVSMQNILFGNESLFIRIFATFMSADFPLQP